MSEEKKETFPVQVRIFLPKEGEPEVCVFNEILQTSQSKYYFSAENVKQDAFKMLLDKLRVEIVLFFPAKDEIP